MTNNHNHLPRWRFTFHNGDTDPLVSVLTVESPRDTEVKLLQAFKPGDVVRVLVSEDSYREALNKALEAYEGAV